MNTYVVRRYVASGWSFLTQADHYEDCLVNSTEGLQEFAQRLAREGFWYKRSENSGTWVMPGAILEIRRKEKHE